MTEETKNIAVSNAKPPSLYFKTAKRVLETEESVQLSALESAIVSAIDAAFLLSRGKVAAISSIKTEYTPVVTKGQGNRQARRARVQITLTRTPEYVGYLKTEKPGEADSPVDGDEDS